MTITATELKTNLGKYIKIAEKEKVMITKNGKIITMLCPPNAEDKLSSLKSLKGITADNPISLDDIKSERLKRQCI